MKRPDLPSGGSRTSRNPRTPSPSARPARSARTARTESTVRKSVAAARQAEREIRRQHRETLQQQKKQRKRFTAEARKRRLIILAWVGGLLALFAAVFGVAYSPIMALRQIEVQGVTSIDPALIQQSLTPQMGTPLPLVSGSEVAEALSAFSIVETYRIEARPPSTIVVHIVERTPIGFFEVATGFEIVDVAGVTLRIEPARPSGLPLLDFNGGVHSRAFKPVASVLSSLPDDLRAQTTRAWASGPDDVQFTLASGTSVFWGTEADTQLKLRTLQALLISNPSANVIDVSAPLNPVIR